MSKETVSWAGGLAQAVECLPSKWETLSSNTSTAKKEKKKKGDGDFPKITNHLLVPQTK
jgi:hypothetical protein